jgi:DNA repair ATPase RecN
MDNAPQGKCARASGVLLKLTRFGLLFGAIYALYLLSCLVIEFRHISSKLDNIDGMAHDIGHVSSKLSALDETNAGIKRMEAYMRYVPVMGKTSEQALIESRSINRKLEITNARLTGSNTCMTNTAGKLMDVTNGLSGLHSDMRHMRRSVDQLAAGFPALDRMQELLVHTDSNLENTVVGVQDISRGVNQVGDGLDEMGRLLKTMSAQFAILPEMKQTFDATSREIPKFAASLQEMSETTHQMNETSREMNQTTQEMAATLKKSHRQGVLGLAALTAAGLAH